MRVCDMFIGDMKLILVHIFKYLGIVFNFGPSTCAENIIYLVMKFWLNGNMLMNLLGKSSHTLCLPLPCYCTDSLEFTCRQIKDLPCVPENKTFH